MSQKVMRRINQRRDGILTTHGSIPIVDDHWTRAVNGDRPNLIMFRRNANAQSQLGYFYNMNRLWQPYLIISFHLQSSLSSDPAAPTALATSPAMLALTTWSLLTFSGSPSLEV